MQRRRSTFSNARVFAAALAAAWVGLTCAAPSRAWAQACCAGSGALTPGRLAMHEDALVGGQLRAASVFGSWNEDGRYHGSPHGTSELDFEQDLFGSIRFLKRAQAALFIPLLETRRGANRTYEGGGGIGDVNLSGRYDFLEAGQSRLVPGIALLAGITFPTGVSPDSATKPLATDATGSGAFQGNVGLALEQSYGHWLLNATLLAAKRATYSVQGVNATLGTRVTVLAAGGYVFDNDAALALLASYAAEGDATVNGNVVPRSSRRTTILSLSGVWPLSDHLRLTGSIFLNPPVLPLGTNESTSTGLTFGVVRSWS